MNKIFAGLGLGALLALAIGSPAIGNEPAEEFMTGLELVGAKVTFTTFTGKIEETWVVLSSDTGGVAVGANFSVLLGQGFDTFYASWTFQNQSDFEIVKVDIDFTDINAVFDTRENSGHYFTVSDGVVGGNALAPDLVTYFGEVETDVFKGLSLEWTTGVTLEGLMGWKADTDPFVGPIPDPDPDPVTTPEPTATLGVLALFSLGAWGVKKNSKCKIINSKKG
ncbi:MAG: hypothetical protein J7647_32300 [Cyanobacteria bacterium SBLK]|nr:hypothetical protein [Cyanobacteria bacterium SBLK]